MRRFVFTKADGRKLLLYARTGRPGAPLPDRLRGHPGPVHLRRHPLLDEWVIYAPERQERTYHPPAGACPFCPGGEVPFAEFEIAVLENRFPALREDPGEPPWLPVVAAPARGRAEVVIYTPEHEGSLATLPQDRRRLLARVWNDRYRELLALPEVRYVFPFENRGEAVGVTLAHPHGQIYAYPFVPPIPQREARAFAERAVLAELWPDLEAYRVAARPGFLAFVPPFARYPYEVWVAPEAPHPGPWSFSDAELDAFADLLGEVVARLDALFERPMPYVMAFHAAPKGIERFHFHVEFQPRLRAKDRLKYLAGTELGAGAFTADVLPEAAARALRGVRP